eukprot:1239161-Rhodomonas_salina.1
MSGAATQLEIARAPPHLHMDENTGDATCVQKPEAVDSPPSVGAVGHSLPARHSSAERIAKSGIGGSRELLVRWSQRCHLKPLPQTPNACSVEHSVVLTGFIGFSAAFREICSKPTSASLGNSSAKRGGGENTSGARGRAGDSGEEFEVDVLAGKGAVGLAD